MKPDQLIALSQPFPDHLVKKAPQGKFGSYVAHSTVTERLLSIVGPFSQRVVETFRDPGENDAITGVILELEVVIDGRTVVIQEAGDCEQPANWKTDGARLKDAVSDGVKRCAMRLGLGLHLWSQSDYFLDKQLAKDWPGNGVHVQVDRAGIPVAEDVDPGRPFTEEEGGK